MSASKRVEDLVAGDVVMLSAKVWHRLADGSVVEIDAPAYTVEDIALIETQRYRLTLSAEYESTIEIVRSGSVRLRLISEATS